MNMKHEGMYIYNDMMCRDYTLRIEDDSEGKQRIGTGMFKTAKALDYDFAEVLQVKPIMGLILHTPQSII